MHRGCVALISFIFIALSVNVRGITYSPVIVNCNQGVQVMFVIDGSDSVTTSDFKRVQKFVNDEINRIQTNFTTVPARVAVMVYSHNAVTSTFVSPSTFRWDERLLKQPRLRTDTASALVEMRRLMNNANRGDNFRFTRVAVVITDGYSLNSTDTILKAQEAKNDGILIVTMGVGTLANQNELRGIASPNLYYSVGPFSELERVFIIWNTDCQTLRTCSIGNGGCQHVCRYTFRRVTCSCYDGYRLHSDNKTCIESRSNRCPAYVDLVWVVDLSDSIHPQYVTNIKNYIEIEAQRIGVGTAATGMGLIKYSDNVEGPIHWTPPGSNAYEFYQQVRNIKKISGGTNTAAALDAARRLLLQTYRSNPQTNQRRRVAVVITDGLSLDPERTRQEAWKLKNMGALVVVISIGAIDQDAQRELEGIATNRDMLVKVDSYNGLANLNLGINVDFNRRCPVTSTIPIFTWTISTSKSTQPTWTWPTQPPWTWPPNPETSTFAPFTWPPSPSWFPSFPTLPPVQKSTRPPILEYCEGCARVNGQGYNPHPSSCSKYIVCLFSGDSLVNYNIFDCPIGLFWDNKKLVCNRPKDVVCKIDPCRNGNIARYADPHDCQVYWKCESSRTTGGVCCRQGWRFTGNTGRCISDPACSSKKCGQTTDIKACAGFRAHPNDRTMYLQLVSGKWEVARCALGSAFPPGGCYCNETAPIVTATVPIKRCTGPEIYLPFNSDLKNSLDRPNHAVYVGVYGVKLQADSQATGGRAAYFDGRSYIRIPRFKNLDWPAYIRIEFRFRPGASVANSQGQALVSNGACLVQPSIAVASFQQSVRFVARTTGQGFTPSLSAFGAGWHKVIFEINRTTEIATAQVDNGQVTREKISGKIITTKSDMYLGHGHGFGNFTGLIDEFKVFLCDPAVTG